MSKVVTLSKKEILDIVIATKGFNYVVPKWNVNKDEVKLELKVFDDDERIA